MVHVFLPEQILSFRRPARITHRRQYRWEFVHSLAPDFAMTFIIRHEWRWRVGDHLIFISLQTLTCGQCICVCSLFWYEFFFLSSSQVRPAIRRKAFFRSSGWSGHFSVYQNRNRSDLWFRIQSFTCGCWPVAHNFIQFIAFVTIM